MAINLEKWGIPGIPAGIIIGVAVLFIGDALIHEDPPITVFETRTVERAERSAPAVIEGKITLQKTQISLWKHTPRYLIFFEGEPTYYYGLRFTFIKNVEQSFENCSGSVNLSGESGVMTGTLFIGSWLDDTSVRTFSLQEGDGPVRLDAYFSRWTDALPDWITIDLRCDGLSIDPIDLDLDRVQRWF